MNENALAVNGLTKQYKDFTLDGVSFAVPCGTIVGLVGENGAGKSTTMNAILGLIQKDAGTIEIFGKQDAQIDNAVRNRIGVVFDGNNFPDVLTARQLSNIFKKLYDEWDEGEYFALLQKISLPLDKKIKEFSKGMKMKLSIAVALSHHSQLLILDEATSGLDPVVRDDILDMFLDFVQDEGHSILVSSHITSDLEKVADYIVFIHQGKVVFVKPKDELRYQYGVLRCGKAQFEEIDRADLVAWRRQDYEWEALVADREAARRKYPKAVVDPATIDEIMLLYVKGEGQ
ncbi:MAG TPA: ABC transporter ATP-binding protein [Candidatus Pullichristensenella stercorigallinarum]|uniref:ABC transporter ATP-binding protein n=1 Tax=Candidatus Pullichristensenella stercorigallinarum TaxID=2840909 RepID=A0A9D1CXW1_9FIRM|nr:ABC transporter ATP-binding protein [Candidatus Pullichristensenella stercorigallinarum]